MGSHRVGHDWSDLAAAASLWRIQCFPASYRHTWPCSSALCLGTTHTLPAWPLSWASAFFCPSRAPSPKDRSWMKPSSAASAWSPPRPPGCPCTSICTVSTSQAPGPGTHPLSFWLLCPLLQDPAVPGAPLPTVLLESSWGGRRMGCGQPQECGQRSACSQTTVSDAGRSSGIDLRLHPKAICCVVLGKWPHLSGLEIIKVPTSQKKKKKASCKGYVLAAQVRDLNLEASWLMIKRSRSWLISVSHNSGAIKNSKVATSFPPGQGILRKGKLFYHKIYFVGLGGFSWMTCLNLFGVRKLSQGS